VSLSLLWFLVPAAPLVVALSLLRWTDATIRWSWLGLLPAVLATVITPQTLMLEAAWPGAQWGANSFLQQGLLGFTAVLWLFAGFFAVSSLANDARRKRFWLFWLTTLSGNLLLIIAGDALSFYVGFSIMSLAAYGLVVHKGGPQPRQAARLYLQIAIFGELVLFTGLMMAAHDAGGSLSLDAWQNTDMGPLTLILLFLGLGLKAGFFPLHVWLPQAHPAAPAPASAVLSGAMIKAGILGMWQMMPATSTTLQQWSELLMLLGLVSALYGVALGLTRRDVKEVLAYSSVSQMGYLLFITALYWYQPATALATLLTLYAIHHGFCKGALFLSAELVKSGRPATAARRQALIALIALPALAVAGLPLTSGGAVKSALKDSTGGAELDVLVFALQIGALASALIMLRAVWLLREMTLVAPRQPMPRLRVLGFAVPALMCLLLPWLWPVMRDAAVLSLPVYKLRDLFWPILTAGVLSALALHLKWQLPDSLTRQRTPFIFLSLQLRSLLQSPPTRALKPGLNKQNWRGAERRWNRFWARSTVNYTAWLVTAVLLASGLSMMVRN